jgi:hypothetical protein
MNIREKIVRDKSIVAMKWYLNFSSFSEIFIRECVSESESEAQKHREVEVVFVTLCV